MLRLAKALWNDQAGFIVSAELVLISSVGVIGLVTGLTCLRNAVNSELSDVSCAISSLDQSYCYTGFHSYKDKCRCQIKARTAGSTNVHQVDEPELIPVSEHAQAEIISERVIGERIISERVIDEQDRALDKKAADEPDAQPLTPGVHCPPNPNEGPTPVDPLPPTDKPLP